MRVQTIALINYAHIPDPSAHPPVVGQGDPRVQWPEI